MSTSEKTELVRSGDEEEKTKGFKSRFRTFKRFVKSLMTHVGLQALVVGYIFLGGYIFQQLESDTEHHYKSNLIERRERILRTLWENRTTLSERQWKEVGRHMLSSFETKLHEHFETGYKKRSDILEWDLFGATFFAGTVVTTIGYGHLAPVTPYGRIACMVYALIGIPLVLVALADIGKVLTKAIKVLWAFVVSFYYTGQCRKVRRGTKEVLVTARQKLGRRGPMMRAESLEEVPIYAIDDEFNLPVWVALLLLLLYLFLGAAIFNIKDEWSYLDAFYFCFVSISTIGFGDLVPEKDVFVVTAAIYIFVGLALASMVITVCQESLNQKYEQAKEQVSSRLSFYGLSTSTDTSRSTSQPPAAVHQPRDTFEGSTSFPEANVNVEKLYHRLKDLESEEKLRVGEQEREPEGAHTEEYIETTLKVGVQKTVDKVEGKGVAVEGEETSGEVDDKPKVVEPDEKEGEVIAGRVEVHEEEEEVETTNVLDQEETEIEEEEVEVEEDGCETSWQQQSEEAEHQDEEYEDDDVEYEYEYESDEVEIVDDKQTIE